MASDALPAMAGFYQDIEGASYLVKPKCTWQEDTDTSRLLFEGGADVTKPILAHSLSYPTGLEHTFVWGAGA